MPDATIKGDSRTARRPGELADPANAGVLTTRQPFGSRAARIDHPELQPRRRDERKLLLRIRVGPCPRRAARSTHERHTGDKRSQACCDLDRPCRDQNRHSGRVNHIFTHSVPRPHSAHNCW